MMRKCATLHYAEYTIRLHCTSFTAFSLTPSSLTLPDTHYLLAHTTHLHTLLTCTSASTSPPTWLAASMSCMTSSMSDPSEYSSACEGNPFDSDSDFDFDFELEFEFGFTFGVAIEFELSLEFVQ